MVVESRDFVIVKLSCTYHTSFIDKPNGYAWLTKGDENSNSSAAQAHLELQSPPRPQLTT
jgi:hypothetical protein